MGKTNEKKLDKRNNVATNVKNKSSENKQQTNSGSSNLESASSSLNNLSENAESKVKKKAGRDVEKSSDSSDDHDNKKGSLGKRKGIRTQSIKKEVVTSYDSDNSSYEPSEDSPSEDENNEDDSVDSDLEVQDVKVCDICGDAGRDDSLCICTRCPDGAEHTYCMKVHLDKVPEGDWLCEECLEEENKNKNRPKYGSDAGAEKDQSLEKDHLAVKVSGKRRAEESESSSPLKKQALEKIAGSTKDADREKVKSTRQFTSDSRFGNEPSEGARSPAARPRLESLKAGFVKSNSFNFPNGRSKTKLVDEIALQRQKSTKERTSHEAREMGKSSSFRSGNMGRFGTSGSKVKMLSPNSSHLQDLKSLKNNKERNFERSNSVKLPSSNLGTSNSTALTPKGDKLPVSSASNSEAKSLKGDGKVISGIKSNSRPANIGADIPVSVGPVSKQLSSSPTGVGTTSSSGISEPKSIASKEDNSSKVVITKESTNLADVTKESSITSQPGAGHSSQAQTADRSGSTGPNASGVRSLKDVKNGDNKLKDAIEAALAKKPGIYRKNRVSDQSDESSVVPTLNNEVTQHTRNAINVTSAEVSTDWHRQISQSSNVDHSKQSNGNNFKQPMTLPAEGKHLTAGQSSHDDVPLPALPKISAIPDHEFIWQGGFEINRSGKTAEFWDGLQAHLSTCASPRVFEAVNKLPHKILLNGVSRISAWPTQFERSGVKEDNIALYFFAKDVESYERSYQVLLDEMIRGDLALIGSINGVELLIFASNQLPERSNRWNMLFFLWGVLRGKKKNSLHQVPGRTEANGIPKVVSSIPINQPIEDGCSSGLIDKDKHVDSESKGNSKLQKSYSQEKPIGNTSSPLVSVNVVPASNKEILSSKTITEGSTSLPNKSDSQELAKQESFVKEVPVEELNRLPNEPQKRSFIDLSEDNDTTNQTSMWRDASSSKKQKSDIQGQNSQLDKTGAGNSNGGERYIFPLDLNEDVPLNDEDLSLAYSHPKKDEDDDDERLKGNCRSTPSMLTYL